MMGNVSMRLPVILIIQTRNACPAVSASLFVWPIKGQYSMHTYTWKELHIQITHS